MVLAEALKKIGLPVIVRPSFTLGGAGGGVSLFTTKTDGSRGVAGDCTQV